MYRACLRKFQREFATAWEEFSEILTEFFRKFVEILNKIRTKPRKGLKEPVLNLGHKVVYLPQIQ